MEPENKTYKTIQSSSSTKTSEGCRKGALKMNINFMKILSIKTIL